MNPFQITVNESTNDMIINVQYWFRIMLNDAWMNYSLRGCPKN